MINGGRNIITLKQLYSKYVHQGAPYFGDFRISNRLPPKKRSPWCTDKPKAKIKNQNMAKHPSKVTKNIKS